MMRPITFSSTCFQPLTTAAAVLMLFAALLPAQAQSCSEATLQGSFGYTATGTLLEAAAPPPFAGPFAETGRQSFDGKGGTDATATLSANGNIVKVTIKGNYSVNPDCTGSMTLSVSPLGLTADADFVIDDHGKEIRVISAATGVVESRVYKKQ